MTQGYGTAAQQYWEAGWKSVLPVPPYKKFPPPTGYTGYNALIPSFPDIMSWMEESPPDANLALRLPRGIIGLDVDAYGNKTGERTMVEAVKRWGPLPPTWRSTSRDDNVSGIRLYSVDPSLQFHNEIRFDELNISHVDIVQHSHRYVMSWPSIHPEGRSYRWLHDNGDEELQGAPLISHLPKLPAKWVEALQTLGDVEIAEHVDVRKALSGLPTGPMHHEVDKVLTSAVTKLAMCAAGSRHDETLRNVLRLIRLGEQNKPGVTVALSALADAYVRAVSDRVNENDARSEYWRMVNGQRGHDLINATPSTMSIDQMIDPIVQRKKVDEIESGPTQFMPEVLDSTSWPEPDIDADMAAIQQSVLAQVASGELAPISLDLFSADSELPDLVQQNASQPTTMREKLLTIRGLGTMKPAEPLIDKLLYRNTLAQLSAEPGSFKTFFVLALACAIASDLNRWEGYNVKHHCPVLYVAAEGANGMQARVLAWCQDQKQDPNSLRLKFYPEAVQLGSYVQMQEFEETVKDENFGLIIIDTRARCTTGLEENSASEQAVAIDAAERIRYATGATVLVIHHSARAGAGAASAGRGSNAWDGAVWSDLRSKRKEMNLTVTCAKHKDANSGCTHDFSLRPIVVDEALMPGVPEQGRTTLVVTGLDEMPHRDTSLNMDLLRDFADAIAESAPREGLTSKQIQMITGMPESSYFKRIKQAERLGMVHNVASGKISRWVGGPADSVTSSDGDH